MLDSLLGFAASPVATLTSWGQALLRWLLVMNAWTAGLLLGALLLDRALAKRARASWRLALYAPVGLRLLLPPSWKIALAHTPGVVTLLIPRPEVLLPPPHGSGEAPAFTWAAALALAYAAVAIAILLVRVRAYLSLRRELRSARLARGPTATAAAPCPVLEHDVLGPMVVGTIRPRIVLPSLLLAPEQADAIACVLGHESAHVRRGDPWLMAALQVLTVACWPVLPLWLAARRVRVLVEMACDEHALDQADAGGRRRYGQALIDIAGWRTVTLSPLGAGGLRFGSGLRARIEALGNVRRWPRIVQAGLVATAVGAFAACSSVGSSEAGASGTGPKVAPPGQAWTAPTGELQSGEDLITYCGPFVEPGNPGVRYRTTTPAGLPPEQVAYCTSPAVRDFAAFAIWVSEAHNALGQIMKDSAAHYEGKAFPSGRYQLCPSGGPVPKVMQAADTRYTPNSDDWNDRAGWECLEFAMDQPMWFQYEFVSDGTHVVAKARARRTNYLGEVIEVTDSVKGEIRPDHVYNIAPNIEETRVKVP